MYHAKLFLVLCYTLVSSSKIYILIPGRRAEDVCVYTQRDMDLAVNTFSFVCHCFLLLNSHCILRNNAHICYF